MAKIETPNKIKKKIVKKKIKSKDKNETNKIERTVKLKCELCDKTSDFTGTFDIIKNIMETPHPKKKDGSYCGGKVNVIIETKKDDTTQEEVDAFILIYKPDYNNIDSKWGDSDDIPIILKDVKNLFGKYFYIKDFDVIDVLFATTFSHILPDDSLWLMIIAQSSGIKTEMLRSLGDKVSEHVHPTSILTENSIISGSDLKNEKSLANKVNNKIWTIKDLTSILSDRSEKVNKIASQLRELYDGYIRIDSGMKGGSKDAVVKTTLIMAVTPYIDTVRIFKQELGERLLYIRIPEIDDEGEIKLREIILNESNNIKKDIRNEISDKVKELIDLIFKCKDIYNKDINIDDEKLKIFIGEISSLIAELRTKVTWDYKHHEIIDVGIKESTARLLIQLKKLVYSLKVVRGKDKYTDEEKVTLLRIMMDSVPHQRMLTLNAIINNLEKDSKINEVINSKVFNSKIMDYIYKYKIPRTTAVNYLDELEALHIIEPSYEKEEDKNSSKLWKFKDEFFNKYKNIINYISNYKGI